MSPSTVNHVLLALVALLTLLLGVFTGRVFWPRAWTRSGLPDLALRKLDTLIEGFAGELHDGARTRATERGRKRIGKKDVEAEYQERLKEPPFLEGVTGDRALRISTVGAIFALPILPFFPKLTTRQTEFVAIAGAVTTYLAFFFDASKHVPARLRRLIKSVLARVGRSKSRPLQAQDSGRADRMVRRCSGRLDRDVVKTARRFAKRPKARRLAKRSKVTVPLIDQAWQNLVKPFPVTPPPPTVAARQGRTPVLRGPARIAVPVAVTVGLYFGFSAALTRLPSGYYWPVLVIIAALLITYLILINAPRVVAAAWRNRDVLFGVIGALGSGLAKSPGEVLKQGRAFVRRLLRRPEDNGHKEEVTPDNSNAQPGPQPESIPQTRTNKAHAAAIQKVMDGASAQNGGNDSGVIEEATYLLAVNPPTWPWVLSAFGILAAGTAVSYLVWRLVKPADFVPSSNYATYAGLFIMALAIERILEPLSGLFIPTTKAKKARSRATTARAQSAQVAVTSGVLRPPDAVSVDQAQKQAAVAQTEFHRAQGVRAVLMWATASILAMLVCAALGIFLLRSVEIPSPARRGTVSATASSLSASSSAPSSAKGPNRLLDLLATGLVVGAGTKPLHDLISQIQTSSGNSKAKASSTTTTG